MPLATENDNKKLRKLRLAFWFSLALIVFIGFVLDHINYNRGKDAFRSQELAKLSAYRAELESILISNIQLVRGLAVAAVVWADAFCFVRGAGGTNQFLVFYFARFV